MSDDGRSKEFAHRCMLAMEQRAYRDPYTGRVVLEFTEELMDAVMADMGQCWNCGGTDCGHKKRRLADFTPEEKEAAAAAALAKVYGGEGDRPDRLVSADGSYEIRFTPRTPGGAA